MKDLWTGLLTGGFTVFLRPKIALLLGISLLISGYASSQSQSSAEQTLLVDDFPQDSSLNPDVWTTDTPLLKTLGGKTSFFISSAWVEPKVSFSNQGMTVSGVSGTYQFTGIQSDQSFSAPFKLQATVMGTVANGNAFELYLVSEDLRQYMSVAGNLNKRNFGYYGTWLSSGSPNTDILSGFNLYPTPDVNVWYTVTIAVNTTGLADVVLTNAAGNLLGSRSGVGLGTGPFFVILAQREGLPNTVGPNSAKWWRVEISGGRLSGSSVASACVDGLASSQAWELSWNDEFNGPPGTRPDPTKWGYEIGNGTDGWGNAELENYVDSVGNIFEDGFGHLVIRATKTSEACRGAGCYLSGRINTRGKYEVKYGAIEACMLLPEGAGLWPAFWMLGGGKNPLGRQLVRLTSWNTSNHLGRRSFSLHFTA